jgi:hypothetical protein
LGDVRAYTDGRLSAEFVYFFGSHHYYRSRIYVVAEGGYIKIDEEQYPREEPSSEQSAVDVWMIDFAFELDHDVIANAQYVVLHSRNVGEYPNEIVVVRLPPQVTVEQELVGGGPRGADRVHRPGVGSGGTYR